MRRFSSYTHLSVPDKANRILQIIFIAMLLIFIRVWQLAVIQHEERAIQAKKPQHREVWERAERATIRDRFNLPLAVNKVQYDIAVSYNDLAKIPAVSWSKDPRGQRIKVFPRRAYIKKLASFLASELGLNASRIDDLIAYKAVLFRKSFMIQEDVTEEQYYRLKILEKDWPGLMATRASKRYYPQGPIAGGVLGHMGVISQKQYEQVAAEMKELRSLLEAFERGEEVELPEGAHSFQELAYRMRELEERAYRMNDLVGKSGAEAYYDEPLRGYRGRRCYYADAKGNFLRELPGSFDPIPGQRILLTISSELQAFAEALLIENEVLREGRSRTFDGAQRHYVPLKQPWMKGGAIVAMDPLTGEVLALASFPRSNPNDFIAAGDPKKRQEQQQKVRRWLEVEGHIADLWEGREPLYRERFDLRTGKFYEEQMPLTWSGYLEAILNNGSPLAEVMRKIKTVGAAIALQQDFQGVLSIVGSCSARDLVNLLYAGGAHRSYGELPEEEVRLQVERSLSEHAALLADCRKTLDSWLGTIPQNRDKLLAIDLCRTVVNGEAFSVELFDRVEGHSLEAYHADAGQLITLKREVKDAAKQRFHDHHFAAWRQEHEASFIRAKRAEEKAKKRYARPLLDYLDQEEQRQFALLWEEGQWIWLEAFLTGRGRIVGSERIDSYTRHFQEQGWQDEKSQQRSLLPLRQKLLALPQDLSIEYLATMRGYYDLNRPLLTTFPGVMREEKISLEKHLARAFYPAHGYGYSRSYAYQQATPLGSIFKLVTAYATLLQKCRESNELPKDLNPFILHEDYHKDPKAPTGWSVGYTTEGKAIPQFYKGGRIPRSHRKKMEAVDLLKAIEASADVYFSIAAGDYLERPEDLALAAQDFGFGSKTKIGLPGEFPGIIPSDLGSCRSGLYEMAIGQHSLVVTPLQAAVMLSTIANGGTVLTPQIVHLTAGRGPRWGEQEDLVITPYKPQVVRELFFPHEMQHMLLEGMRRVIHGAHGTARPAIVRTYDHKPQVVHEYRALAEEMVGKSSTAEKVERYALDGEHNVAIYNHVWFGGISYAPDQILYPLEKRKPELVVVVFLPYGDYGREAAPLMSQMVKKWRALQAEHSAGEGAALPCTPPGKGAMPLCKPKA